MLYLRKGPAGHQHYFGTILDSILFKYIAFHQHLALHNQLLMITRHIQLLLDGIGKIVDSRFVFVSAVLDDYFCDLFLELHLNKHHGNDICSPKFVTRLD